MNRIKALAARAAARVKNNAYAFGIGVAVVAVIVFFVIVGVASIGANKDAVDQAANKDQEGFAVPVTRNDVSLSPSDATNALRAIDLLRSAFEQLQKSQGELATAINADRAGIRANTADIKALKSAVQGDPKTTDGFAREMEAIQKLMEKPAVKLEPLS